MSEKSERSNKRRWVPMVVAAAMLALVVASGIYYYCHTVIRDPEFVKPGETDVIFQVESVTHDGEDIVISGWCFEKDTDTKKSGQPPLKVLLKPTEGDRYLSFKADYGIERPDVGAYFNGEHDFTYSGFQVRIPANKLDAAGTIVSDLSSVFEVALQQNEHRPDAVLTGVLLKDGEWIEDPSRGIALAAVEGTDLEEIVSKGYLCVSRPDLGVYVYQTDHELYYILDENYRLDEGWDYLQYQPKTTQPEKLPPERYEAGYTYDSLEFIFSYHEITSDIDAGPFRVARVEIPSTYGITVIETGVYQSENDEWIWKETFKPDYLQLGV